MSNAYTTPSDVFEPEALGDTINTYLYNNLALIGSGYVGELKGAVWSRGGSTVTFPTFAGFDKSTAVKDLPTNGTSVESSKITMSDYTKPVASKILSLAMTGVALEDVVNDTDLFDKVVEQVGASVQDSVDQALITEAETTTLAKTTAATITFANIVAAKMLWNDKATTKSPALIVHSKVYQDLINLDEVKTFNNWGGAGTIQTGAVPYVAGMPVFVSDNVTTVAGTPNTYRNLLISRGALEFGFRRNVTLEIKTTPGNDLKFWDFTYRFAVHLRGTNPLGVVKLITQ